MPPASRLTDIGLGHGSYAPTPVCGASPNVITCSLAQARQGDCLVPHPSPSPSPPHPRSISKGSTTVFTNSKQTARIGDPIDCGGMLCTACGTVIVGG